METLLISVDWKSISAVDGGSNPLLDLFFNFFLLDFSLGYTGSLTCHRLLHICKLHNDIAVTQSLCLLGRRRPSVLDLGSVTMSEDTSRSKLHFVEAVYNFLSKEGWERYPQAFQGMDKASQDYIPWEQLPEITTGWNFMFKIQFCQFWAICILTKISPKTVRNHRNRLEIVGNSHICPWLCTGLGYWLQFLVWIQTLPQNTVRYMKLQKMAKNCPKKKDISKNGCKSPGCYLRKLKEGKKQKLPKTAGNCRKTSICR